MPSHQGSSVLGSFPLPGLSHARLRCKDSAARQGLNRLAPNMFCILRKSNTKNQPPSRNTRTAHSVFCFAGLVLLCLGVFCFVFFLLVYVLGCLFVCLFVCLVGWLVGAGNLNGWLLARVEIVNYCLFDCTVTHSCRRHRSQNAGPNVLPRD